MIKIRFEDQVVCELWPTGEHVFLFNGASAAQRQLVRARLDGRQYCQMGCFWRPKSLILVLTL